MKNKDIFHPIPEFINPIYVFAQKQKDISTKKTELLRQKEILRKEALERIKNGTFENGIAPLYEVIGNINAQELNDIFNYWHKNNLSVLYSFYKDSLISGELEKIRFVDKRWINACFIADCLKR